MNTSFEDISKYIALVQNTTVYGIADVDTQKNLITYLEDQHKESLKSSLEELFNHIVINVFSQKYSELKYDGCFNNADIIKNKVNNDSFGLSAIKPLTYDLGDLSFMLFGSSGKNKIFLIYDVSKETIYLSTLSKVTMMVNTFEIDGLPNNHDIYEAINL